MARRIGERPNKNNGDVKVARSTQQDVNRPNLQTEQIVSAENQILQRLHPSQRAATLASLGTAHGNRHVQRVVASMREAQRQPEAVASSPQSSVETKQEVVRLPFHAEIQRGDSNSELGQMTALAGLARSDSPQQSGDIDSAHEKMFKQMFEQTKAHNAKARKQQEENEGKGADSEAQSNAEVAESAEVAEPFELPDIEIKGLEEYGKNDAVEAKFGYEGSIAKDGPDPEGFGVTRSFASKLTNIKITPKAKTFTIDATFEHPITYQVRKGTGPDGQRDVASETDSKITKANYETVAADLTPNMSDLNGRPPRSQFWAEDLTERHELVHANDDLKNGPDAMETVVKWLGEKEANDARGVNRLLTTVPNRFAAALLAALSTEDGEKRAYGDGAPLYRARATAIKAKGDKGDYA